MMVNLFWAHLCLEFAVRVCCGRLLIVATNPSFCFKIVGTMLVVPSTSIFVNRFVVLIYPEPICKGLFFVLHNLLFLHVALSGCS